MKENFGRAVEFVFKWEGGLVKDPRDPGGTTKWGISQRAYPRLDIENLTKDEAARIYKEEYWDKIGGDNLPFPFDIIVFDTAVNIGCGRAIRMQGQSTCGKDFLFNRIKHYTRLKSFNTYGRGWINRTLALYDLIKRIREE